MMIRPKTKSVPDRRLTRSALPLALCLVASCSSSSDICQKAGDLCTGGQDFSSACEGSVKELASCVVDRGDCQPATLMECAGEPQMDGLLRRGDGGLHTSDLRAPLGDSATSGDLISSSERAICDRYLACAAVTSPATLPGLQEGYGPSGSCWASGSTDLCLQACRKGLSQLRAAGAGELACRCIDSSECLEAGASYCDPLSGQCGKCSKSIECGGDDVCHRSPQGTRCRGCGGYYPDNEVCGLSHAVDLDLWSAAPACVFQGSTPTCVQCSADMDCGGEICNLTTYTCPKQYPSCLGIWQCLRFAPVECQPGGGCCNQQLCPQSGGYVACMAVHCAGCTDGDSCISCSMANCQAEYKTCDGSCVS